jgi:hypothetical protein
MFWLLFHFRDRFNEWPDPDKKENMNVSFTLFWKFTPLSFNLVKKNIILA